MSYIPKKNVYSVTTKAGHPNTATRHRCFIVFADTPAEAHEIVNKTDFGEVQLITDVRLLNPYEQDCYQVAHVEVSLGI